MGFLKKYYDNVDKYRSPMQAGGLTIFDLIRPIYELGAKDGKIDGKKEGYIKASDEYEKKLLKQAEEFLNQTKDFYNQKDEYEQLMNEYEIYIEEISAKKSLSNQEQSNLNKIILMERRLSKYYCG